MCLLVPVSPRVGAFSKRTTKAREEVVLMVGLYLAELS